MKMLRFGVISFAVEQSLRPRNLRFVHICVNIEDAWKCFQSWWGHSPISPSR